ncbi:hypothetical protein TCAL_06118 [Tigriopus californicus]|uniref:Alpha-1,3/1,6-mannosyltransferase ALG2 n=1 Tax=Tigriopus californicus TaxID=6832 RepID=A0A553NYR0_TIGCA|nr:hypothetical protein TCAL_06118 [Tigriopus californicus]|eukprot:TCALIF_06118-PA protein Name:"Similar to Alg2 Alpha-1,3/1,6-mannosyltransferase ALG2 (Mus musculus)" AED:0.10 eAED:0.10 QI:0/0/0/1/1/1/4/0/393
MVRVVFLHPDLGIGGAERLVVDAGLALKARSHQIHFVTAHHDPAHCFEETQDGTLDVVAVGDWLPRHLFGRCMALCAYLRMIYAALWLVVIVDQISVCIPILLALSTAKIIFYCHFPDQLLTGRQSLLKRLYRAPIDWLEEVTTGAAHIVLVNSKFTAGVFHDTFKRLNVQPEVLYPSLNTAQFEVGVSVRHSVADEDTINFLSINRFERKKNLPLAIRAFAEVTRALPKKKKIKLIVAGGYDTRVTENIEHLIELETIVLEMQLSAHVEFRQNLSDQEKLRLLRTCDCLLYTPSGEHFGIVPIEAMFCQLPVIAVNNGGPKETVVHAETGFLCDPQPAAFAEAMSDIVKGGKALKVKMGNAGRKRVMENFSFGAFSGKLDRIVQECSQFERE